MGNGVWCMLYGVWKMVYGVWNLVYTIRFMVDAEWWMLSGV